MERLEEIDRQLAALGQSAGDTRAMLERVLGRDRSLEKLDELLAGLGEVPPGMLRPRTSTSKPPRRKSGRPSAPAPRATPLPAAAPEPLPAPVATAAVPEAPEPARPTPAPLPFASPLDPPAPAPASSWPPRAARSSLPPRIVTSTPPVHSSVPAPAIAAAAPWPPRSTPAPDGLASPRVPRITDTLVDTEFVALPPIEAPSEADLDAETAALLGDFDAPVLMPSAVPLPFGPSVETSMSQGEIETRVGPPPGEIEAAAEEREAREARERRDNVRALLDQEIDPHDFPSQRPSSARPSERPAADYGKSQVDDDGVEMLLDDEEILEIEDDELLEDADES